MWGTGAEFEACRAMINETIFMTSHSGRAHVIVRQHKYPKCGGIKWKWADIKLITFATAAAVD